MGKRYTAFSGLNGLHWHYFLFFLDVNSSKLKKIFCKGATVPAELTKAAVINRGHAWSEMRGTETKYRRHIGINLKIALKSCLKGHDII